MLDLLHIKANGHRLKLLRTKSDQSILRLWEANIQTILCQMTQINSFCSHSHILRYPVSKLQPNYRDNS